MGYGPIDVRIFFRYRIWKVWAGPEINSSTTSTTVLLSMSVVLPAMSNSSVAVPCFGCVPCSIELRV